MSSVSGCRGKIFVVLNFLFWLIGLGTLGYGIWIFITTNNFNNFLSGTLVWTYSLLGIGVLLVITGLIGCIAGCCESTCCLKAYIGLMVTILIIDIGVAITGAIQKNDVFHIMDDLWGEINDDTKYQIQSQLQCCGFTDSTEYGTTIPSSCYANADDATTLYTYTCNDAMQAWVESNIPVWASVIGGIALIQILSTIMSCLVLKSVEKNMRVEPFDGN